MATENGDNSADRAQTDDLVADVVQIDQLADDQESRRKVLGRLAAYTAPTMLALLTSEKAFAIHSRP
jgi:hypothetical protein